jgi:Helix-turn-helix domain
MTIMEMLPERRSALTPRQLAEILGRNERTVRNWLNDGKLPEAASWAIDPAVVAVWWEANTNS